MKRHIATLKPHRYEEDDRNKSNVRRPFDFEKTLMLRPSLIFTHQ